MLTITNKDLLELDVCYRVKFSFRNVNWFDTKQVFYGANMPNCPKCGKFLSADGKCTNTKCPGKTTAPETGSGEGAQFSPAQIKVLQDIVQSTVQEAVKDLSNKLDAVTSQLELKLLEIESLKIECQKHKEENEELLNQLHSLQQYTRKNNLLLHGVPVTQKEDVYSIIQNCTESLQIPITRTDIDIAHRIPRKNNSDSSISVPPIVIKFTRRTKKHEILTASTNKRKTAKEKNNMDVQSTTSNNWYFTEHLAPNTAKLLNLAKQKAKALKYKFVWVKEGKVYVRKDDGQQAIKITSEPDVSKLE